MALLNEICGHVVYLDYDVDFELFRRGKVPIALLVANKLCKIADGQNGLELLNVHIRKSAGGNAHVALTFKEPLDLLNAYVLRAALKDDVYRLMLDMTRYFNTQDINQCNLIWTAKFSKNQIRYASDWEPWDYKRFLGKF